MSSRNNASVPRLLAEIVVVGSSARYKLPDSREICICNCNWNIPGEA